VTAPETPNLRAVIGKVYSSAQGQDWNSVLEKANKELRDLIHDNEKQREKQEALMAEVARLQASYDTEVREWNSYAHMCQNDHVRIGHSDSDYEPEELSCPVCRERNRREALEERITALEGGLREIVDARRASCAALLAKDRAAQDHAMYRFEESLRAARALLGGQG